MILLGIALQGWAAVALGIAVGVVLDYLGVADARETGRRGVAVGGSVSTG
jgi:hypothetical protein